MEVEDLEMYFFKTIDQHGQPRNEKLRVPDVTTSSPLLFRGWAEKRDQKKEGCSPKNPKVWLQRLSCWFGGSSGRIRKRMENE